MANDGVKRGFHPTQRTQRNERKQSKKRKKRNERNSRKKRELQPIGNELSSWTQVFKVYKFNKKNQ